MKDFFVSYTGRDIGFATWVAEILEEAGYSVVIQAWDFHPGDNFVTKIDESLKGCKQLIMILSEDYLKSKWCEAEWTSKLAEQMRLRERRIIPIKIAPIQVEGLLSPIVYIDIVDKGQEAAKEEILSGIKGHRERKAIDGYPGYYNVEHIQIDNDYCVMKDEIIYQKRIQSRVLKEGFNKLHNRITWFIDEKVELVSMTEGVSIEYLDLKDTNINYNVVFDHNLAKGEIIEYCIKAILSNKHHHFGNFFSTEVITPIKNLNIHLRIEGEDVKKYYTQKISNSPMNIRTEEPVEHNLYDIAHWYITDPELNFEYKMFW